MLLSIPFGFCRPTMLQRHCEAAVPRRRCYHNHLRRCVPLSSINASTLNTAITSKQCFLHYRHLQHHYHLEQMRFLHDYVIRGTMVKTTTPLLTNSNDDEGCYRRGLALNDIRVGQYAEMERVYTRQDVDTFSSLIGDFNPLHQEWRHPASSSCAEETTATTTTTTTRPMMILPEEFLHHPLVHWNDNQDNDNGNNNNNGNKTSKILVHGMLVANIFSGILGTLFPGSVYRGQSLQFRNPVYCQDCVVGRVTITAIKPTRVQKRRQQQQQRHEQETTERTMQDEEEQDGLILMCDTQVLSRANGKKNEQRYRVIDEDGNAVKMMTTMKDPNGDRALDDDDDDDNEKKVVEYIRGKATVWLVP